MLPKETRGDAVNAVIRLNYGDENSLKGIGRYAGLMIQMLMRGSRGHTRQEIEDELARLQSQLNIGGGSGLLWPTSRARGRISPRRSSWRPRSCASRLFRTPSSIR